MTKNSPTTRVQADGLRYKSKQTGSPFAPTGSFGSGTMSCFLCGKHRSRNLLKTRKLLGKSQAVCAPSCSTVETQGSQTPANPTT